MGTDPSVQPANAIYGHGFYKGRMYCPSQEPLCRWTTIGVVGILLWHYWGECLKTQTLGWCWNGCIFPHQDHVRVGRVPAGLPVLQVLDVTGL